LHCISLRINGEVKLGFNGDLYPSAGASVVMTTKGDMVDYNTERQRLGIGSSGQVLAVQSNLPTWIDADSITHNVAVQFACGDETTAIDATGQKLSFRMPFAMTLNAGILGVKGSLVTAGTGALLTVDINEAGSTILSTKLTFDASETTTISASTPVVISDVNLSADAIITVDIDQLDGGGVATGLKITLMGSLA
jgi:hypothetical protein